MSGALDSIAGRVMEAFGKVTGRTSTRAKGKAARGRGRAKKSGGRAKKSGGRAKKSRR
jgi:uncharacterized protein YjbJ (UPF0337 family)